MTAVSLGSSFEWPANASTYSASDTSAVFNEATADYACFVLRAPATGTIDKAHIRLGSGTLTGTISCQIQTLDASGDPSGTAYGSCAQIDITNPAQNSMHTFSSLACSATAGDHIAVKIWCSAWTSGNCSVVIQNSSAGNAARSLPYVTSRTTGAGAGTKQQQCGAMTLEYSGGVYYDIDLLPACTTSTESVDSDGTLRRIGNRIIVPAPVTVDGIWALLDWDTDTTTLKLYDTDGTTVLATATLVTANRQSTSAGFVRAKFDSATTVNLTANTASPYRVVVETNNTSATAATIRVVSNITAAHMAQMPGGTACYYTSHNGTAWTDTTTKRASIGLLVSKIDDGAGSGGGLAIPVSGRIVA